MQDETGSFFGTTRPEPIAAFAPKLTHPDIMNPAMAPIKAPYTKRDKTCKKKKMYPRINQISLLVPWNLPREIKFPE